MNTLAKQTTRNHMNLTKFLKCSFKCIKPLFSKYCIFINSTFLNLTLETLKNHLQLGIQGIIFRTISTIFQIRLVSFVNYYAINHVFLNHHINEVLNQPNQLNKSVALSSTKKSASGLPNSNSS